MFSVQMDRRPIKIDPDECIPTQHLQLEFNQCHRCIQQDVQIQALQIENGQLKQLCSEQSQVIDELKTELTKFQCKPEQFDDVMVMPLSPAIAPISAIPQWEQCTVCMAEYMTTMDQKHICNGDNEIGCEYCGQLFTSTSDLVEHLNGFHNEKSFYRCTKCPEMFSMAQLLQFHIQSHPITEPVYICNICGDLFPTKDEMDRHYDKIHKRTKTKNSKMQSARQSLRLPIEFRIDKPIVRVTKRSQKTVKLKPFKCANCNECFSSSTKIKQHMRQMHSKTSGRSFECYICKMSCKSLHKTQIHLREHIMRNEKCVVCQGWCTKDDMDTHICVGLKLTNCGYCQQTFMTTKYLLAHLQDCKSEKISYECGKCPKFFLMESLADLHRKNHTDDEPPKKYSCTMCSNTFNCRRQLKLHKERHNESRDFLCDECGKGFLCVANLRHHKRTHNKKSMKCPQCDFTAMGMTAYKRHLLRHQNIKFICNICDLQLSTSQKLSIHKKIHTRTEADRIHTCSICFKKFFTSKSARSHFLKAHTTKRFECDLCDQSYKYKGDLNKHKRAIHSVGYLYACPHCLKRFPQSYELDHHLFEHAKEPEMGPKMEQM